MRSALWRIFTLAFLVGLFHLPVHVLDLFHGGQAFAATSAARQEPPAKPKRSRTSRIHLAPTALGLTTIQNLRTASSPGLTRLVLDLDTTARPNKHPQLQAEGVTIEIPNATLSQSAKTKLTAGRIAKPFIITQSSERSVEVSLPAGSFQRYKLLTLANPHRLVIDVVPSSDPLTAPPVDLTPGLGLPLPTPPQPAQPRAKSFKTIVIDPGHGGKDPGARGQRGTEEKDITLKVALKLRDLLSRQPGVRVLMTRDRDEFVELEDRAKFANGQEADLFVSIHVNSHPQRSVKGIEIYHFGEAKDQRALEVAARENGTPLNSTGVGWEYLVADLLTAKKIEASLELAWTAKEAMVTNLNDRYSLVDHGVKTAPFYVLRFTSMPSILAEIAYISNSADEDMLRTGLFTTRVAEALMEGVNTFLASAKLAPR
ncbi:MAG TPA: N-acetylmuramoyl-L-alanine amidase [Nitrospiraceae bacterium]|jgi:N-acetylmuramoyl-L-alanine amidase|nr:N-acetylmuramoyl-L-alanine amidase [Nitrospiraceae bacterium]